MEYIKDKFNFTIKAVGLDLGYQSLDIKKYLIDEGIMGVIGYRRFGTKKSRSLKREL